MCGIRRNNGVFLGCALGPNAPVDDRPSKSSLTHSHLFPPSSPSPLLSPTPSPPSPALPPDVKPSNMLLDREGNVKLCDFGISGRLVNSQAFTRNAGCAAFMAVRKYVCYRLYVRGHATSIVTAQATKLVVAKNSSKCVGGPKLFSSPVNATL